MMRTSSKEAPAPIRRQLMPRRSSRTAIAAPSRTRARCWSRGCNGTRRCRVQRHDVASHVTGQGQGIRRYRELPPILTCLPPCPPAPRLRRRLWKFQSVPLGWCGRSGSPQRNRSSSSDACGKAAPVPSVRPGTWWLRSPRPTASGFAARPARLGWSRGPSAGWSEWWSGQRVRRSTRSGSRPRAGYSRHGGSG
jgi:hypothetical protein